MPEIATSTQTGFVLKSFVDLTNWKSMPIFDLDIETVGQCPCDGGDLEVIAELTSQTTDERIRLGCCSVCGFVTYIDRPSQAAVSEYYKSTWMGESPAEAIAKAEKQKAAAGDTSLLDSLGVPSDCWALEIGAGYGGNVALLKQAGHPVIATESCPVRAQAIREAFGIEVFGGDFEHSNFPGRFPLISCHHVLEHAHDPAEVIAKCATLQEPGDVLLFSMPDFDYEPSIAVLLFWPHLHTFTKHSLAQLLGQHGYGVFADIHKGDLCFAACKRDPAFISAGYPQLTPESAVDKLQRGCGLKLEPTVLTWQRDFDGAVHESPLHAYRKTKHNFPRRLAIEPITNYLSDAPIEIQFPGRVEMCFK
jgi:SAM-dependent methyltransferase